MKLWQYFFSAATSIRKDSQLFPGDNFNNFKGLPWHYLASSGLYCPDVYYQKLQSEPNPVLGTCHKENVSCWCTVAQNTYKAVKTILPYLICTLTIFSEMKLHEWSNIVKTLVNGLINANFEIIILQEPFYILFYIDKIPPSAHVFAVYCFCL